MIRKRKRHRVTVTEADFSVRIVLPTPLLGVTVVTYEASCIWIDCPLSPRIPLSLVVSGSDLAYLHSFLLPSHLHSALEALRFCAG